MSWNYRLVRDHDGVISLREVYYDPEKGIKAWTEIPAWPHGSNLDDLQADLNAMGQAFKFPILEEVDLLRRGATLAKPKVVKLRGSK